MEKEIEFMDLQRQYNLHKKEFMNAIEKVCDDTAFSGGKYADQFEKEFADYLGVSYCSCVDSGTAALHLAMRALGISHGDEVIVPANTFIASAWGAEYEGATPVFVDCCPDTWEIDASKIEEKITDKTKAIIGVHLYGQPFDFDAVDKIAKKRGLFVVEDCAQAHGAIYKGRKAGTLGDIACFSFYPGKNLGAFGEAGAIVTNEKKYFDSVNIMKNHGSSVRYRHDVVGYNLRMDGIQGAILSVKLKYLDEWNQKRQQIAKQYRDEIHNPKITLQEVLEGTEPVYHLFEIHVNDSNKFMSYMQENNIYCARHYPVPCHLQKVFLKLGYQKGDIPVAESHAEHCISLPMFPELTQEEINRVISACNHY